MEIFGFICLVLLALYVSGCLIFISIFNLGPYTIGGAYIKWWQRLLAIFGLLLVPAIWYFVWSTSPFTIMVN